MLQAHLDEKLPVLRLHLRGLINARSKLGPQRAAIGHIVAQRHQQPQVQGRRQPDQRTTICTYSLSGGDALVSNSVHRQNHMAN